MENHANTNSNAIISLILGVLALLIPVIGVVFGIIGIILSIKASKQIKISNEGGKGLATAGLICSIVGLLFQTLAIIAFVAFFGLVLIGASV